MRKSRICGWVFITLAILFCSGLSIAADQQNFKFVVIGDNRPSGTGDKIAQPAVFHQNIEEINLINPDFVLLVGDLILGYNSPENKDLTVKQWDEFDRVVKKFKVPFYLVAGNHDIWDATSQEIYEERYGKLYYSFTKNGCHFVILCGDIAKENQIGRITGKQLEWLQKDLEKNAIPDRTFVLLHEPLWQGEHVPEGAVNWWTKDVHPLMVKYKVNSVFAGHIHAYSFDEIDGVRYVITGGAGAPLHGTPATGGFYHYVLASVTPKEVTLAVIHTGSIKPQETVTAEFRRKLNSISGTFVADIKPVVAGIDSPKEAPASFKIENVLDQPLTFGIDWAIDEDTDWSVSKKSLSTTIAPGMKGHMECLLSCKGPRMRPLPVYSAYLAVGKGEPAKIKEGTASAAESIKLSPLPAGLTIDGKLDEWQKLNSTTIAKDYNVTVGKEAWKGLKDCSAKFWLTRDAEAIYLAVEVTDDDAPRASSDPKLLWNGDAVEVFFDFRAPDERGKAKYGPGVVHLCYAPAKADGDVISWAQAKPIEGFVGKSKKTDEGYAMELKFPIAGLKKANLGPGETFNFDIAVNDADAPSADRKCQIFWSSDGDAFGNASRFGRVLSDK